MYVHRRCKPSKAELDMERTTHGYCGICGNQGTIYLVKGTEDSYRHKRQGVTYTVTAVNTTDTAVLDEIITPVEMPLEEELTEETEAIVRVAERAVEVLSKELAEREKQPDKVDLEAVAKDIEDTAMAIVEAATKQAVEAEPEVPLEVSPDSSEIVENGGAPKSSKVSGTEQPLEAESDELTVEEQVAISLVEVAAAAKKAEIERLEAALAKLKK